MLKAFPYKPILALYIAESNVSHSRNIIRNARNMCKNKVNNLTSLSHNITKTFCISFVLKYQESILQYITLKLIEKKKRL